MTYIDICHHRKNYSTILRVQYAQVGCANFTARYVAVDMLFPEGIAWSQQNQTPSSLQETCEKITWTTGTKCMIQL